jgi:dimethylhistidine N-methyltransferase
MPDVPILDLHPPVSDIEQEVRAGLLGSPPTLPCKLFYDARGSELFDQITEQPEYYPTRSEVEVLHAVRDELSELEHREPGGLTLVELGSGSTAKAKVLLDRLDAAAYVPVDISRWYLEKAADELTRLYQGLTVRPVLADYNQPVPLPEGLPDGPKLGFFPGGTIGNFTRAEAVGFLQRVAHTLGQGGRLVVGVDLKKDPAVLHAAYNDAAGVTGAFNLNVINRLNAELDLGLERDAWTHYAPYVPERGRIEMYLVALRDQAAVVGGQTFEFPRGTAIHTESSHKYTRREFAKLAGEGGYDVERVWTDEKDRFSVQLLRVRNA